MTAKTRTAITWVLLLIPFAALLDTHLYARMEPRLLGVPFFYWYQFLWVPITALLTFGAFLLKRDSE